MTTVPANLKINIAETKAKVEAKGFQPAEVNAILEATESFNGMNMTNNEEYMSTSAGGGKEKVDIDDSHIKGIAVFAINEHNKEEGTQLYLIQVLSGFKIGSVGGNIYQLTFQAFDRKKAYYSHAMVYETYDARKLLLGFFKHYMNSPLDQ